MKQQGGTSAERADRGFVSLAVTVVILLITYACYRFAENAVSEHRSADAQAERMQLEAAADSAEALILAQLADRDAESMTPTSDRLTLLDENPYVNQQVGGYGGSTRVPHFTVIGLASDAEGRWQHQYGPVNESARLSISILPLWEQQQPGSSLAALMQLPGIDPEVAESLVRRLVEQQSGYLRRSGLRYTLDQLLEVPGLTRELLYGDDRNFNGLASPLELPLGPSVGQTFSTYGVGDAAPWAALLTPYSAERNVNQSGQPRINLNLADLTELRRQLQERLPAAWVDFIIAYRTYGPAVAPPPIAGSAAVGPIASVYDLIGAEVRSGPDADAPLVPNPFPASRAAYRDYLFSLVDETTVDPRPIIPGRVNINLAPTAVLRGIPGVDSELVNRIALARERSESTPGSQRRLAAWLVAEGWIEPVWMRELAPYITAGGDVFHAQIVAFLAPGEEQPDFASTARSPFVRRAVVVDATGPAPRVAVRRDLSNLGRGFSREALEL